MVIKFGLSTKIKKKSIQTNNPFLDYNFSLSEFFLLQIISDDIL